jgi:predicted nucleotidyltransferase component of viral defense system
MKPLRSRLYNAAVRTRVSQVVVEKDYALDWIATTPELSETLLFKGGTALRKIYFGDYRFSDVRDHENVNKRGYRQQRPLSTPQALLT